MQRIVNSLQEEHTTTQQDEELNKLKSKLLNYRQDCKKFYIWPDNIHKLRYKNGNGQCCFWDIIGRPKKDGKDMPALPYQQLLLKTLHENQCIWIKKSRGLGVSEFLLRYIAYCCVTEKFPKGSRVCITTGPNISIAEDLISNRFKGLFSKVAPNLFDRTKSKVAILNDVKVEAFPSHNIASMRGLDNVKFIMSDESDFYPPFQQKEVRAVMEGYIGKPNSNPTIVIVSTPNAPGGLMQQIELEKNSLYYCLFFDYHYGLQGPQPIYSQTQIDIAKKSPEWPREYELQYIGVVGNVFSQLSIENATKVQYNPDIVVPNARVSVGIDPSFGSSKFGIVATRFVNERIELVIAEEHDRPDFNSMIDRIHEIKKQMGIDVCYVDAANPEIWQSLKKDLFHETYSEAYVKEKLLYCANNNTDPHKFMDVIPIAFSKFHSAMLQHAKSLVEDPSGVILIDKQFDKLLELI